MGKILLMEEKKTLLNVVTCICDISPAQGCLGQQELNTQLEEQPDCKTEPVLKCFS